MNDAVSRRSTVLEGIKRALGGANIEQSRRAAVEDRLRGHRRNLVPQRGQRDRAQRIDLFKEMAQTMDATVAEVTGPGDVPGAVASFLRGHNLPLAFRHGDDSFIDNLPWEREPVLERRRGPSDGNDEVALSHAFGGVAETGTLVLASGPENPTTLNFLPETHVVIIGADSIAAAYEDIWDRLRLVYGEGSMPRTINMITGPSRTADIEQTLLLGAHGPRRLHVIIVDQTES